MLNLYLLLQKKRDYKKWTSLTSEVGFLKIAIKVHKMIFQKWLQKLKRCFNSGLVLRVEFKSLVSQGDRFLRKLKLLQYKCSWLSNKALFATTTSIMVCIKGLGARSSMVKDSRANHSFLPKFSRQELITNKLHLFGVRPATVWTTLQKKVSSLTWKGVNGSFIETWELTTNQLNASSMGLNYPKLIISSEI